MFKEFFDKKKLITFDLDGTTVKSEEVWGTALKAVIKTLGDDRGFLGPVGVSLHERWIEVLADNVIKTDRPISELIELTQTEFINNIDKLELTEGFWSFVAELKLLKKLNLALVTNTSRTVAEQVISKLELKEVFDYVICGNEVKKPKPDPEIYKKTMAHFKLQPKEVLAFEDSLTGCISAAKAGIEVICVWDEQTPKRKFPDAVVDFTDNFIPFSGEMDTTPIEDLKQMAKEQEEAQKLTA
jgi:beta-phosphoglucomutase-like phosphatase (HAD superfamily)